MHWWKHSKLPTQRIHHSRGSSIPRRLRLHGTFGGPREHGELELVNQPEKTINFNIFSLIPNCQGQAGLSGRLAAAYGACCKRVRFASYQRSIERHVSRYTLPARHQSQQELCRESRSVHCWECELAYEIATGESNSNFPLLINLLAVPRADGEARLPSFAVRSDRDASADAARDGRERCGDGGFAESFGAWLAAPWNHREPWIGNLKSYSSCPLWQFG